MKTRKSWRKQIALLVGALAFVWLIPSLLPFEPNQIGDADALFGVLEGVSSKHLLGTNGHGMDSLTRMIYGGQTALLVVLPVIAIAFILGVGSGFLAGWSRGVIDQAFRAFFDFIHAMPGLLFAIAMSFGLSGGKPSYFSAILSVVVAESLSYAARFFYATRARVLVISSELYVQAAISMGAKSTQIFSRHFFGDVSLLTLPLVPQAAAAAISSLAGLGFLGIGVTYGVSAEWGFDLAQAIGPAMMGNFLPLLASGGPVFLTLLFLGFISERLLRSTETTVEAERR